MTSNMECEIKVDCFKTVDPSTFMVYWSKEVHREQCRVKHVPITITPCSESCTNLKKELA